MWKRQFGNHFFIAPYLLYACGPHITSAQEAGVILSLRQSRRSAQTLKSLKKFFFSSFPPSIYKSINYYFLRRMGDELQKSLHDSWCWKLLEGRSGGRSWNIHSLMQKHKWMKFCSCFQAVLRIEKKKCLENKMFILSFWLWPSQFFVQCNRRDLNPKLIWFVAVKVLKCF